MSKMKTNMIPPTSILWSAMRIRGGSKTVRILDPSSGGMGIRLNTAKSTFIKTIWTNRDMATALRSPLPRRIKAPTMSAMAMFEAGPIRATFNGPYFKSLWSCRGLYGTGFAQPIMKGDPVTVRRKGKPLFEICEWLCYPLLAIIEYIRL